jgi:hypothetical protein
VSGFEVQLDDLAAAAATLRGSLEVVGGWNARSGELSAMAGRAGHRAVVDAIRQFCDEWGYGFGHLAGDIEGIAGALEQAGQIYGATDRQIADAAGGGS